MGNGILEMAFVAGDGGVARRAGDADFPAGRSGGSAEAVMNDEREGEQGGDGYQQQGEEPAFQSLLRQLEAVFVVPG